MSNNLAKEIEKNKNMLRQLTALNNEMRELKNKVKKLEQNNGYPNKAEFERMNTYEGSD